MELLLIRHGLPIRRELVSGPADPELSAVGIEQAEKLAEYLSNETIDAVYSSPLRRAIETAQPLAKRAGLSISILDQVAEYDRLSNEYVPIEELKEANDPRWHKLVSGKWESESDTFEQFRDRVVSGIESLVEDHPSQKVAIVCHGGVINQYLARVLRIDTEMGFFYPQYTSIHRVIAAKNGLRSLTTLNEVAHLR